MADPVSLAVTVALNAASMALTASQQFEGQRLDSTAVTNSDYGSALIYFYGTRKLDGLPVIYAEDLREEKTKRKTKGGKYNEYRYFGTFAVGIADHEIDEVLQVWFDEHLVYDATGAGPLSPFSVGGAGGSITNFMRIYLGTATQDPDPRMLATIEAREGVGSTPAYRNVSYLMFEELPLEKLGNRLPQVKVLATANGAGAFPYETFDTTFYYSNNLNNYTFSPDASRIIWVNANDFEQWDVAGRAQISSGTLSPPTGGGPLGIANNGDIYTAYLTDLTVYPPDGLGPGTTVPLDVVGTGAKVLQIADGNEFVFVINEFAEGVQYASTSALVMTTRYPSAEIGAAFLAHDYILDGYGDVWAVGSPLGFPEPPGTTEMYLWRIIANSTRTVPAYFQITGLDGRFNPGGHGFHSAADSHFVIARDQLYAIDDTTGAIKYTRSLVGFTTGGSLRNVPPGATSFWLLAGGVTAYEISVADLSTIRTISLSNWRPIGIQFFAYDRVNHALIASEQFNLATVNWYYLDRATGNGVTLQSIVEDVAVREGLSTTTDIDATDLDQIVLGYSWTQGTGKQIVEHLLEHYNSDARPHDFLLEFIKRTGTGSGQILTEEMGASPDGDALRYRIERTLDSDLPLRASLTFADPAIDQQPNTVVSQRIAAAVDSAREVSLDQSTHAMTATDARSASDAWLRRQWYNNEGYDLSVSRAHSALEPGDVKLLEFDGTTKTAKLSKLTFNANGVLDTQWRRDLATVHVPPGLPGVPASGITPPVIAAFGYTKGFVLDIPLVRDVDDGLITYIAAAPYSDANPWPGAVVYESDDGIDYANIYDGVPSDQRMTWGSAQGVLPDADPDIWDRASTLTVLVQSGTLASVTEAQAEAGQNAALIGDEIVYFVTATLVGTNTYTLSTFLRGRRGTEQHTSTHVLGDRFVMLDTEINRHLMGASDLGDSVYYKPTTAGGSETAGFPELVTYTGASLKPYSPVHLNSTPSSGDKVLTWVRRTRIGGDNVYGMTPPLGEGSEAYEVDILNAGGSVIRTITGLSSPMTTYTAAQQSTDSNAGASFRVYQISTTVGRGFPATASL